MPGMWRISFVHGICFRKLKVWTTCDSICARSRSSSEPLRMESSRTSSMESLRCRELVGIPQAVQLLVMSTGDAGNVADLFRPRNLLQEVEGVDHVRLDLRALAVVERALADREQPHFVHGEQRLVAAVVILVMLGGDLEQLLELPFRQHGGFVGAEHEFVEIVARLDLALFLG